MDWGRSTDEDADRDSDFGSAAPEMVESREGAHRCSGDGAWCSCVGGRSRGGIQASQLFRWRRQLHGAARFASLTLEVPTDAAPITALPMSPGVIEVDLTTGARLRICGPVDAAIVAAVMQALTDCWKPGGSPISGGFIMRLS